MKYLPAEDGQDADRKRIAECQKVREYSPESRPGDREARLVLALQIFIQFSGAGSCPKRMCEDIHFVIITKKHLGLAKVFFAFI